MQHVYFPIVRLERPLEKNILFYRLSNPHHERSTITT